MAILSGCIVYILRDGEFTYRPLSDIRKGDLFLIYKFTKTGVERVWGRGGGIFRAGKDICQNADGLFDLEYDE